MDNDNDFWDPISLLDVSKIFAPAQFRWWISGCHALELHLDRSWRKHHDIDVSFCRKDYAAVQQLLTGWQTSISSKGILIPWLGEPPLAAQDQNNLRCKETSDGPWRLDLTVSDGSESEWIYRRNTSMRLPWELAVLRSPKGIPYLAPELQLLFKSKDTRGKDDQDAAEVIPELDIERRNFLKNSLPENHSWRKLLT